MSGAPKRRVVIDLDCETLCLDAQAHCDLLFVGEDEDVSWVAPVELKSGHVNGTATAAQLQGGASVAEAWLANVGAFRFVPILVHGGGIHRAEQKKLRRARITLRGHSRQPVLIRCGAPITAAFTMGT